MFRNVAALNFDGWGICIGCGKKCTSEDVGYTAADTHGGASCALRGAQIAVAREQRRTGGGQTGFWFVRERPARARRQPERYTAVCDVCFADTIIPARYLPTSRAERRRIIQLVRVDNAWLPWYGTCRCVGLASALNGCAGLICGKREVAKSRWHRATLMVRVFNALVKLWVEANERRFAPGGSGASGSQESFEEAMHLQSTAEGGTSGFVGLLDRHVARSSSVSDEMEPNALDLPRCVICRHAFTHGGEERTAVGVRGKAAVLFTAYAGRASEPGYEPACRCSVCFSCANAWMVTGWVDDSLGDDGRPTRMLGRHGPIHTCPACFTPAAGCKVGGVRAWTSKQYAKPHGFPRPGPPRTDEWFEQMQRSLRADRSVANAPTRPVSPWLLARI